MPSEVFDSETLPNYTLVAFKDLDTGAYTRFRRNEPGAPEALRRHLARPGVTFIGFNSLSFDRVVLAAFCAGRTEADIKRIANALIEDRLAPWEAFRRFNLPEVTFDHIDLIEVAPSFVGLKSYGARMHMPKLQSMPIQHDTVVTAEQMAEVDMYCDNDLDTTEALTRVLESELMLRVEMSKRYAADMRSKSDSQMAEQAYITSMGLRRKENKIPLTVTYTPPEFLRFETPALAGLLQRVTQTVFEVNQTTGHVKLPDFLGKEVVEFREGRYQLGVGGIHSTHDKSVCHIAGSEYTICDIDAASFYPSIILECGFVPAGLGEPFVKEYRQIYERRLAAKKAGDKSTDATLKISLNGTFGKLASKYSVLYAPDLMLAVTLTGQFTLLMLIEWLEYAGATTLSANTDGIAIRYRKEKEDLIQHVVNRFSQVSRFVFEFTPYRVLAMKDVNNYLAIKPDRSVKAKGIYAPLVERKVGKEKLNLRKNPTAQVCSDAVAAWLADGTPFAETIKNAPFVDFLSARNVTGGGEQAGEYLGGVVRWYQSTDRELPPLTYIKNGNKVPKTEGARACMELPVGGNHPADLDYSWYLRESVKIASDVGCSAYLTEAELKLIAKPPKPPRARKGKKDATE